MSHPELTTNSFKVERVCPVCGSTFLVYRSIVEKGRGIHCSKPCRGQSMMGTAERFWSRVDRSGGQDACWEWQGPRDKRGYGRVRMAGKDVLTHRVAWELTNGLIPEGMCDLHRCDNPPCCNPAHLFLGSYADNNRDMAIKGRVYGTKLTPDDVRAIRRAVECGGESYAAIGKRFGVNAASVGHIVSLRNWKHVE